MQEINSNYKIVDIDSVIQDPENARVHDENDIKEKMESLKMFGFTRPLLVNSSNNVIAAGNGIHQAAKKLGYTQAPVIFMEMSPVRAKALSISDNKLGDHGKYNIDQFTLNIQDIAEWDVNVSWKGLGFDKSEIDLLLSSINNEVQDVEGSQPNLSDEDEDIPEEERPAKGIKVNRRQRELFEHALNNLQKQEKSDSISEGDFIEILCNRFLD